MVVYIKAPKATQVKFTGTPIEANVEANDILFELHDFEEKAILSQLDRAIEENRIKKLEAEGEFVRFKLETLSRITDYRGTALTAAQLAYSGVIEERKVGQKSLLDVVKARQDVALRSYMILQSSVEYELYRRNAVDSINVFNHVELLLLKEKEYVDRCRSRLRILAPTSGSFKRFVSEGTPVRVGHLLGEIH